MFFKKTSRAKEMILNKEGKVELDIPIGTEIENQVQMIGLTKEDLRILTNLQPFVNEQIDNIVTGFYENLVREPSLLNIINNHSSIDRLRQTLKRHITEMFDGVIDQPYYEKRIRIAHVHVRIGLKTKWYMCAFQDSSVPYKHYSKSICKIEMNVSSSEGCNKNIKPRATNRP